MLAPHLLPDLPRPVDLVVLGPDAPNDRAQHLVALRARRAPRRIALLRLVPEVRRRGDRQDAADRLDPELLPMVVDERDHHFARRSSSACAKYADAFLRISFARCSSTFSRSSSFSRSRSSVVRPDAGPRRARPGAPTAAASRRVQPSFSATDSNRRPLRRMLGGVLQDHPDGALTQLRGILARSSHGPHPLTEWALRQTRYGSKACPQPCV